ncbi:MAG: tRNA 2-thiouridine(34) synthase MnmA [Nitriliruptoraceae bacterium]
MARVLVAMSGGVDSAVAAALLVEQGHEVTGVHLRLADLPLEEQVPGHGCCTLDDAQDARRSAQVLGIPFYVWDLSEAFEREVQTPFAAAYAAGRTPNPCVTCNERVKYAALLDRAVALGFDALATGHHARLRRAGRPVTEPGPGVALHRAADRSKDQSYVLYVATPAQLARTLLPVGERSKQDIRSLAGELGLRVASKPDSYDVCFIPDGDTAGYLGERLPSAPGPIVDADGSVLGTHDGVWRFTVGQRRGLGLDHHERRFVTDVDAERRTVRVGPREELACRWAEVDVPTWTLGAVPEGPVRVQIRAHGGSVPGRVVPVGDDAGGRRAVAPATGDAAAAGVAAPTPTRTDDHRVGAARVRLELEEPVFGLALGQAAVVYDATNEICLGGGRVVAAERPAGLPLATGTGS